MVTGEARRGIRVADLSYPKELAEKLRSTLDYHNFVLTKYLGVDAVDFRQTLDDALAFGEYVEPMKFDVAGILHDVVEDTSITLAELQAEFGEEVARLVAAVSEQKTEGTEPLPWKVRKEAQLRKLGHADRHIAAIKTADALHNLQATLCDLKRRGPQVWTHFRASQSEQLWYYRSLLEVLTQRLGDHPLLTELSDALAALQEQAP